jgi:pyruvate dehydrogenase E2 component (dihydrolipoamide acetyltransferase)
MAIPVEMPKMSDTMTEGVLVTWLADEGQQVTAGDVIAQVETDKATMDLEVYDDGVLLKRVIGEGEAVPIGGLIAVLGKKGEDISAILAKYEGGSAGNGSEKPAAPVKEEDEAEPDAAEAEPDAAEAEPDAAEAEPDAAIAAPDAAEAAPDAAKTEPDAAEAEPDAAKTAPDAAEAAPALSEQAPAPAPADGRVKASPLARRLAGEHGIEIGSIPGSGPEGRIVKRDVEAAVASPAKAPARPAAPAAAPAQVSEGGYESVRISQMRKTVARRLVESKFSAPHFYLTLDVDMTRAVESRQTLNALSDERGGPKISYNDLVTKACAVALRAHPAVNSSWMEKEGELRRHADVHVAIAVAVEDGLIAPVIRHADRKGLVQIAEETQALAARARAKELQPEDYLGSTFSTSNLGMFGIEEFTAIINPPNACILAIGAIRDVPVVQDGAVVPGKRMKVTLSCDHRVVDGATGAQFLVTVKALLEEPLTMLL